MNKLMDRIFEKMPVDVLTDDALKPLIGGSVHRQYAVLKRATARGDLVHVRRGLYVTAKKYQRRSINLYELAQQIYGPSYVSFESALSYHGWIPEAVYTVTSASVKRSKEFRTPLGTFAYNRVPANPFYTGVERIESPHGIFFMATPLKALADYVYVNKKNWMGLEPAFKDLRIDAKYANKLDLNLLNELKKNAINKRVMKFIKSCYVP